MFLLLFLCAFCVFVLKSNHISELLLASGYLLYYYNIIRQTSHYCGMGRALTYVSTTPSESQSKLNNSLHFLQRDSPDEPGDTLTHNELHRYSFPSVRLNLSIGHRTGNMFCFLSSKSIITLGFILSYILIIQYELFLLTGVGL